MRERFNWKEIVHAVSSRLMFIISGKYNWWCEINYIIAVEENLFEITEEHVKVELVGSLNFKIQSFGWRGLIALTNTSSCWR